MKPRWDRTAKLYALGMYFSEAMTVLAFLMYCFTGSLIPAFTSIILAIASATLHLLLQNYAFHQQQIQKLEDLKQELAKMEHKNKAE